MDIAMLGDSYTFGPVQDLGASYAFGPAFLGEEEQPAKQEPSFVDKFSDFLDVLQPHVEDTIEHIVDLKNSETGDPIDVDKAPPEPTFFEKNKPLIMVGGVVAAIMFLAKKL